jgi:methylase of polypeptide subunit release factors
VPLAGVRKTTRRPPKRIVIADDDMTADHAYGLACIVTAPLPDCNSSSSVAFDIGTGTGVLAAVLARPGIRRVVATDQDPRALACAVDNLRRN